MNKPLAAAGLSVGFMLTAWIGYWGFTTCDPGWPVLILAVPLCLIYATALVWLYHES